MNHSDRTGQIWDAKTYLALVVGAGTLLGSWRFHDIVILHAVFYPVGYRTTMSEHTSKPFEQDENLKRIL